MEPQPPKWQFLNKDETEEMRRHYSHHQLGWCQAGDSKYLVPYAYATQGEDIWRIKVRATDRWVVTFPRSGTTWIQELVWLINNNLNFEEAVKKSIAERYAFPELSMLNLGIDKEAEETEIAKSTRDANSIDKKLESMSSPRFFKFHLPFELLPPNLLDAGCKVVYVARNPKDVIVSYFHLMSSQKVVKYIGDFSSFWNFFRSDRKLCCPYWAHVKEAWSLRHHPNLLFLFYEEMKTDLPGVIRRVGAFYGRPCSEDEVAKLANHLDIENFKKNPMIDSHTLDGRDLISREMFVRKGQIGGWKELFTPELEAQADEWIEENLRGTDLAFPHV